MPEQRILSLDAFRGATVAAMILVNNPGSWDSIYPPLEHAQWNGCTPTDLIFPFFLVIVGMSIHFAYQSKKAAGLTRPVAMKIFRRTLIIFGLGILLAWFPVFSLERLSHLRIPGVLQRISLVFMCCSLLYLSTQWLTQLRTALVLLIGYFMLMTVVPVPDTGVASLEPETNLGAWLDRFLLSGHLWSQSKTWDPEGLLSTLPAIASGIIGLLAGQLFSSVEEPAKKTVWLFMVGGALTVAGLAWGLIFPINKSLWTSSFVLYTGGIALQVFAVCYWLVDVLAFRRWATPFIYFGTNAIFVFVMSGAVAKLMIRTKIGDGDSAVSVWGFIYRNVYASWLPPRPASLAFALTFVALFLVMVWQLYKRKIFVKV